MKKLLKLSMLSTSVALGIMASGGATAQGACSVAYTSVNNWGAGAQIRATITNTSSAKTSWELCWTYAGNETIQNLWDGTFTQTGKNVCVKNAGYNGNLPVNGSASFGFIVNNPGAAPTAYTLNGVSCGNPVSSSSVISSSSTPVTSSSRSSSSVNNGTAARWLLDATNSTFHFVTVKKNATTGAETPENMTFNTLQGTVSNTGLATLTIPLASINTGIALRDTRMQDYIFESSYLPNLHFTAQLDLAAIEAMAAGSTAVQSVTGNLTLHGINKSIVFDALVVKNGSGNLSFSPKKPIVINSTDFDINYGVEYLRNLMGLGTIGEKVPVYFKMFLTNSNPTNIPAITLATAPAAPLSVSGTAVTSGASLNWADASATETGFLVRRKGADGRWFTAKNVAANTVSYLDALTTSGSYDYKLISYTDSIPSVETAPVNVMYLTPTSAGSSSSSVVPSSAPSSISSSRSSTSSMSSSSSSSSVVGDRIIGENLFKTIGCAGCHQDPDEDGVFVGVPFNVNSFTYPTLNVHKDKGYTGATPGDLSRFIKENMIPQLPSGCTTANCSDHLASYLWSLKGREQDNSCAVTPPVTYGIRSLKLLTSYEYGNSLKGLFRVPLERDYSAKEVAGLDANINHLPNHIAEPVSESRLLSYKSNAEAIAAWSLRTAGALPFTCGTDTQSATCATEFLTKFAYPAFRRPLTTEETTEYTAIVRNNASGLRWAIQSVLMSPQFLYRTELGVNVSAAKNESWGRNTSFAPTLNQASTSAYALDPYEFASALSFMYQGSAPDATLLQAAANGLLENPTSLSTQIDRLIDSPLAREHVGRLAGFWFRTNSVVDVVRMDTSFNDAVRQSMAQEIREIYKQVFYNNLPFTDIYKGEFTMLNSTLSSYYGIPGGGTSSTDWRMVNTANSLRGGVLASGAFMAVNAHSGRTSPIFRAVHVRQDMLCQSIPLPPPFDPEDKTREEAGKRAMALLEAGNLTTTDFYDIQTNVPGTACFLCHRAIINPLFALDDFNNVGKPRTVQNGKVLQPALDLQANETRSNLVEITMMDRGSLYGSTSTGTVEFSQVNDEYDSGFPGIPFKGSKALGNVLASENLPGVNACLINKSYRYAVGHPLSNKFHASNQEKRLTQAQEQTLACVNKELNTALTNANNNPRALMKAIGMSKALRFRQ